MVYLAETPMLHFNENVRAWELAQWAKCLMYKHQQLNMGPQHYINKKAECISDSNTVGQRQSSPQVIWRAGLDEWMLQIQWETLFPKSWCKAIEDDTQCWSLVSTKGLYLLLFLVISLNTSTVSISKYHSVGHAINKNMVP